MTKVSAKWTRMIGILAVGAVLASGCAGASKTYGPDGKEAFSINCSGWARGWGMCYEKAGEICGTKGYTVVGKEGDSGFVASGNSASSVISRSLTVTCKE